MVSRTKFPQDKLIAALDEIADQLTESIEAFFIGGLSMIFHGAKLVTKDVDIVFLDLESAQTFVETAHKIGLHGAENLKEEYRDLEARCVLEGKDGVRFDIFVLKVCDALIFSQGMISRAQKRYDRKMLKLFVSSIEDIFLFKAITSRPDDLADMATIAGKEIQWNIIKEEVKAQPENWKWISRLYLRLLEMEDVYDIPSPLKKELKDEAEIAEAIGILMMKWEKGYFSFNDAQKALDEDDTTFVKTVIEQMKRVKIIEEKNSLYFVT
jgi:hypothetical protein